MTAAQSFDRVQPVIYALAVVAFLVIVIWGG
jgi:hypothetical protein